MHAAERKELILELLRERGFIAFRELDSRVAASPATLRRDLDQLEEAGDIVRVRGGARLPRQDAAPSTDTHHLAGVPFHENVARQPVQKRAIGRAAAALCAPGEAVIIDGGSTTLQMCPHLADLGLQVLTNSLNIVSALLPQPRTRISIPAGALFREQNIVLSPYEDDGMGRYRGRRLFMGAASIGPHGVMQDDVLLVQAERRWLDRVDEVVLLVDSTKFDAPAGHVVCPLEDVDILITDVGLSEASAQMLARAGVKLIVAE
jgi:DeoR family transcriptional regulator, ulaG and ulaABCDEF operon transcriptional repressor